MNFGYPTAPRRKRYWRSRTGGGAAASLDRRAAAPSFVHARRLNQYAPNHVNHVRRRCAPSLLCLTLPPPTVRCCRSPRARKEKTCKVELTNRRPRPRPLATARHCDARCAMCCTASHQGRGTGEGADQRATLNARDCTVVHAGVHQGCVCVCVSE